MFCIHCVSSGLTRIIPAVEPQELLRQPLYSFKEVGVSPAAQRIRFDAAEARRLRKVELVKEEYDAILLENEQSPGKGSSISTDEFKSMREAQAKDADRQIDRLMAKQKKELVGILAAEIKKRSILDSVKQKEAENNRKQEERKLEAKANKLEWEASQERLRKEKRAAELQEEAANRKRREEEYKRDQARIKAELEKKQQLINEAKMKEKLLREQEAARRFTFRFV